MTTAGDPVASYVPGSFRDRSARVIVDRGEVFRTLDQEAAAVWDEVRRSQFFSTLTRQGKLVETREATENEQRSLSLGPDVGRVLHHSRVPCITYPYEWSFGMLKDAALLQLEVLAEALREGFILKDATPYNVQFIGAKSVFIDIGSFVKLEPGEPWSAYQQFCELFLYPLLLQAHRGIDFQFILRSELEGISAEEVAKWFSWRDWWRRGVFSHVVLHAMLARATKSRSQSTLNELQNTGFPVSLIQHNVERMTRLIQKLSWEPSRSKWSDYDQTSEMVARDSDSKAQFVKATASARRWSLAWDLGCNLGRYALIAAEHAEQVLAMDFDHLCVETLYRQLKEQRVSNVIPLRMNVVNSSPALGWRGRERTRLEERGLPDLVLCLGLIHHMVIAANIPLAEVVEWMASLKATLVIEFPTKNDPMVLALLRNKRDQYQEYAQTNFEQLLSCHFDIQERLQLPSGERFIYRAIPLSEARSHDRCP